VEQEERTRDRMEVIDGDLMLASSSLRTREVSERLCDGWLAGAARAAKSFDQPGQSRGEGEVAALLCM
jgi:hypothetical protein